jgi:hypothetical protein
VHPLGSCYTYVSWWKDQKTLNFSSYHTLVVFNECISCLLVAFCASNPRLIKANFQCWCFHCCSVLYPMPPTSGTHANFSIKIMKLWSQLTDSEGELFSSVRNSVTECQQNKNTVDSHFVTVVCGYIMVCMCWTSISGLRGMTPPAWYTAFTIMCNMMSPTAFITGLV